MTQCDIAPRRYGSDSTHPCEHAWLHSRLPAYPHAAFVSRFARIGVRANVMLGETDPAAAAADSAEGATAPETLRQKDRYHASQHSEECRHRQPAYRRSKRPRLRYPRYPRYHRRLS
ncbi:hypothetical protein CO2235_MP10232 [Cupriavidus oxalaticus]|uniref:Uncharacterized protein n=1 Tax=Cupriavidus oxalaticus TaxID=96344 RepID=A0A976BG05_9BURK|nr:hypothetical protein CO2235_MP10232 [Cupriavidus oxalaticus]